MIVIIMNQRQRRCNCGARPELNIGESYCKRCGYELRNKEESKELKD